MFRDMRRIRQQLSPEETAKIMQGATSGVLALSGDDGYPYAVPMSYLYDGDKLYFHCAKAGHKIDSIARCDKASFCVIAEDNVMPEKYTTCFCSAIAFGKIHILTDEAEIRSAVEKLAIRYAPNDTPEHRSEFIESDLPRVCVLKMEIEHITGKECIELVRSSREK